MGVDMWAAEILLRMKEQQAYQDVELCLALPFEGYNTDSVSYTHLTLPTKA